MRTTITIFAFAISILCGCVNQNVNIQTTKCWENHYMTVESFKDGTKDMSLQKGESVWVLSNTTLKRVLKETSQKK